MSFQPHLCAQGKAPKQIGDAGVRGGRQLRLSPRRRQVRRVPARALHRAASACGTCSTTWSASKSHDNGDIAALQTREHGALAGDLFVDCTGLQSLLLGRHYRRAVRVAAARAVQRHRAGAAGALSRRATARSPRRRISTAQSSGWIWDIGLPTRRGIGHVYSSAHTSDEAAERELRGYVERVPAAAGNGGHAAQAHVRAGLSPARSGIATASPSDCRPASSSRWRPRRWRWSSCRPRCSATRCRRRARRWTSSRGASTTSFTYRWERVIDFLKLHYVLSRRTDSRLLARQPSRRHRSRPAARIAELWRHQPPSRYDLHRIEEVFPSASYQYVLYGMGFRPEPAGSRPAARTTADRADAYFREAAALTAQDAGGAARPTAS